MTQVSDRMRFAVHNTVDTQLVAEGIDAPATGVLFCRDTDETVYAWNLTGEREVSWREKRPLWQRWRTQPPSDSAADAFAAFFPEIDLDDLTEHDSRVRRED